MGLTVYICCWTEKYIGYFLGLIHFWPEVCNTGSPHGLIDFGRSISESSATSSSLKRLYSRLTTENGFTSLSKKPLAVSCLPKKMSVFFKDLTKSCQANHFDLINIT